MFTSELLALAAATCIARWQMLAAVTMTGIGSLVTGGWHRIALWQVGFLAASSLFGIIIASTTYFAAIYAAGAHTIALMFSLTAPFALLLGYLFLGETIGLQQAGGILLVLGGIVLAIGISTRRRPTIQSAQAGEAAKAEIPWAGTALISL